MSVLQVLAIIQLAACFVGIYYVFKANRHIRTAAKRADDAVYHAERAIEASRHSLEISRVIR